MSPTCIVQGFKTVLSQLQKDRFIESEDIRDYRSACQMSLHSHLQYALVKAGLICGFHTIPEFNIGSDSRLMQLGKPIDKKKLGISCRNRHQRTITTDVAFISSGIGKRPEIRGIGEICTLDEIQYCLSAKEIRLMGHRDKLMHLLKYSTPKISFAVLIGVFPESPTLITRGKNKGKEKLPWEQNYHSVAEWEKQWKKLTDDLNHEGTDVKLISVKEKLVDVYP